MCRARHVAALCTLCVCAIGTCEARATENSSSTRTAFPVIRICFNLNNRRSRPVRPSRRDDSYLAALYLATDARLECAFVVATASAPSPECKSGRKDQ